MSPIQLGSTNIHRTHNGYSTFAWMEKGKNVKLDAIHPLKVFTIIYSLQTRIECLLHASLYLMLDENKKMI